MIITKGASYLGNLKFVCSLCGTEWAATQREYSIDTTLDVFDRTKAKCACPNCGKTIIGGALYNGNAEVAIAAEPTLYDAEEDQDNVVSSDAMQMTFDVVKGSSFTYEDESIKDNMVVASLRADGGVQGGDWTIRTGIGNLTISGTIADNGRVTVVLVNAMINDDIDSSEANYSVYSVSLAPSVVKIGTDLFESRYVFEVAEKTSRVLLTDLSVNEHDLTDEKWEATFMDRDGNSTDIKDCISEGDGVFKIDFPTEVPGTIYIRSTFSTAESAESPAPAVVSYDVQVTGGVEAEYAECASRGADSSEDVTGTNTYDKVRSVKITRKISKLTITNWNAYGGKASDGWRFSLEYVSGEVVNVTSDVQVSTDGKTLVLEYYTTGPCTFYARKQYTLSHDDDTAGTVETISSNKLTYNSITKLVSVSASYGSYTRDYDYDDSGDAFTGSSDYVLRN